MTAITEVKTIKVKSGVIQVCKIHDGLYDVSVYAGDFEALVDSWEYAGEIAALRHATELASNA